MTAWNAMPGRIRPIDVKPSVALTTEDTMLNIQASANTRIVQPRTFSTIVIEALLP